LTPLDINTFSSHLRIFARNIEKLQYPVAISPKFTKRNFILNDLTKKFSKETKNRDRKIMKLSHCAHCAIEYEEQIHFTKTTYIALMFFDYEQM